MHPDGDEMPAALTPLSSGPLFDEAVFIGNELFADRRPAVVVQPSTVDEVAAALMMAQEQSLPFSVKCGGHSYAGYCLNTGGVMVDLSRMQGIEVDEAAMTVQVGCGVRWLGVYKALAEVNPDYMVMGGICPDVGISGAVLGGGINLMSRTFGLAIDSLVAVSVLTADGELLELNGSDELEEDLKSLWWAVRGGGGGNFGIVVSFTLRIFDIGPLVIGALTWDDLSVFGDAVAVVNAGLSRQTAVDAVWLKASPDAPTVGSMTVSHLGSLSSCEADVGARKHVPRQRDACRHVGRDGDPDRVGQGDLVGLHRSDLCQHLGEPVRVDLALVRAPEAGRDRDRGEDPRRPGARHHDPDVAGAERPGLGVGAECRHDLVGIGHLRHPPGVHETHGLDPAEPCPDGAGDELDLGGGGEGRRVGLQAVPRCDLDDLDRPDRGPRGW